MAAKKKEAAKKTVVSAIKDAIAPKAPAKKDDALEKQIQVFREHLVLWEWQKSPKRHWAKSEIARLEQEIEKRDKAAAS